MFLAASVCLSVCLSVCYHSSGQTHERIFLKIGGPLHMVDRSDPFDFQQNRTTRSDMGAVFLPKMQPYSLVDIRKKVAKINFANWVNISTTIRESVKTN